MPELDCRSVAKFSFGGFPKPFFLLSGKYIIHYYTRIINTRVFLFDNKHSLQRSVWTQAKNKIDYTGETDAAITRQTKTQ